MFRKTKAKAHMQALGRLKTGQMNKTEAEYDLILKLRTDVIWHKFEGLKFRLADNTFYTPDFAVLLENGELECHEVKGFWQDDARVKIKVAADLYPIRFLAVMKKKKEWQIENFSGGE